MYISTKTSKCNIDNRFFWIGCSNCIATSLPRFIVYVYYPLWINCKISLIFVHQESCHKYLKSIYIINSWNLLSCIVLVLAKGQVLTMESGDGEFDDKRLAFIYNELVKSFKFKYETWTNMLKTPSYSVRTTTVYRNPFSHFIIKLKIVKTNGLISKVNLS